MARRRTRWAPSAGPCSTQHIERVVLPKIPVTHARCRCRAAADGASAAQERRGLQIKTTIATTNEKITAARPLTYWSSAMCDCRGLPSSSTR